jgi:hypothetical protein
MFNVVCLYVDESTNGILRCVAFDGTFVPPDFYPARVPGYSTKYHMIREYSRAITNEYYLYEYDLTYGVKKHGKLPTQEELDNILILNKKFECIEILFRTMVTFNKTTVNDFYHSEMVKSIIDYEMKNELAGDSGSLTDFLMNEQQLDFSTFKTLHDLQSKFIYEKKKDLYKSMMIGQTNIFNSSQPSVELTSELFRTYYLK